MYQTGEKPGKGEYQCYNCGSIIRLDDDSEPLPKCSKCGSEEFIKLK
ncbi:MAG TPA: hypothetical protein DG942_06460 [Ruminococcaceae bacterium]|jgi:DNA-directed RNA polymerase subunit RPC12/RpoP|nr:hypothetical protein [Oscillospiraceae bacterium]